MQLELNAPGWHVINDGVMGGKSSSLVISHQAHLLFRGTLSLQNGGGFASARCRFGQGFNGNMGFRVLVRGDARSYQLRLRETEHHGSIAWSAVFNTDGSMQAIDLPFSAFRPVRRGSPVKAAGVMQPQRMRLLGFLLADRQEGPFELEVHRIDVL